MKLLSSVAVGSVVALTIAACGISLDVAPDVGADATTSSTSSGRPSSSGAVSSSSSSSTGGVTSSGSGGGSSSSSTGGSSSSSSSSGDSDACIPLLESLVCLPNTCGTLDNGCGGTYDCGACGGPNDVCLDNICCIRNPQGNACSGNKCGAVSDGCGGTYDCGECADLDDTCGGGTPSVPNECGCTEETREETCNRAMYRGEVACGKRRSKCGAAINDCPDVACAAPKACVDCIAGDGDNFGCCQ